MKEKDVVEEKCNNSGAGAVAGGGRGEEGVHIYQNI